MVDHEIPGPSLCRHSKLLQNNFIKLTALGRELSELSDRWKYIRNRWMVESNGRHCRIVEKAQLTVLPCFST